MDVLLRLLTALAVLNGLTLLGVVACAYELRQLRMGRASMSFWERVEAIHRITTPAAPRRSFYNAK